MGEQDRGAQLPDLSGFEAVLFDLDGVLTPTAEVHMRAWSSLFQPLLAERGGYRDGDYFAHLDGKQRYPGVASLLAARGIELPWGDPSDPPEAQTVCGLGNRKDLQFRRILAEEGVRPYPGSLQLLDALAGHGVPLALVSSSKNAASVLTAAGLEGRFPVLVDGLLAEREGLASKPSPQTFLSAAQRLGLPPSRLVVVEDAVSGVAAGRAGAFGLVVGVDRGAGREALLQAGADLVVADLAELALALRPSAMDRQRFPVDPWRLLELRREPATRGHAETLFSLGNGYLGLRGNDEEGGEAYEHGTFVNGFHETWPIHYPERAYAFAEVGQTILDLPDAKTIQLEVDGHALDLDRVQLEDYQRSLDFDDGLLRRRLVWRLPDGGRVEVRSERMVSFAHKHLALMRFAVTPLDRDAELRLTSSLLNRRDLQAASAAPGGAVAAGAGAAEDTVHEEEGAAFDPRKGDVLAGRVLQPEAHGLQRGRAFMAHRTRRSGMGVAAMVDHRLEGEAQATAQAEAGADAAQLRFAFRARRGSTVTLTKLAAYHDDPQADAAELLRRCHATLDAAWAAGVPALFAEQRAWMDAFWAASDVQLEGQPALQQAVRWNVLQLAQAAARADGRGVSAKGVSGSGYSGHYFWDTEIYVLPALIYGHPDWAKQALRLRHRMLPAARQRAREMAEEGALFPWRTINGQEASAYYPAGTAQYHIDADISYALAKYVGASGDRAFLAEEGIDIAVETARMWASLGFHRPGPPPSFHLHGVTGPDEYTAVVDDNLYTNAMARRNLRFAADAVEALGTEQPEAHRRMAQRLGLRPEEPAAWRRAADAMFLPYDPALGVHGQDAHFLGREPWDPTKAVGRRPLLQHFHPLVIYRHQVLKQADLVLAHYLLSLDFEAEQKRADFEYYDPITTGDSTLSAAVQSIMAAEVGYQDMAYRHFMHMLHVDLGDLHRNAADGVHVASTGGAWMAMVGGFAGLRDDDGRLRFDPRLPSGWPSLRFRLAYRGSRLAFCLRQEALEARVEAGGAQGFWVRGVEHIALPDRATVVPLQGQGPRLPGVPMPRHGGPRADGA